MATTEAEIRIHPGYQFGRPCIAGTRIPTSSLAELVQAGDSVDEVAGDYAVSRDEVLLACWYEWNQVSRLRPSSLRVDERRLRDGWAGWAGHAFMVLAGHRYGEIPDPPATREGRSQALEGTA